MKGKNIYLPSFYLIISIFSIFLINQLRSNSVYFMPKEYKTIKKIVDKLASKNDLGNRDIPFSIGSGRYMAWRAEDLGLCKRMDVGILIILILIKNIEILMVLTLMNF